MIRRIVDLRTCTPRRRFDHWKASVPSGTILPYKLHETTTQQGVNVVICSMIDSCLDYRHLIPARSSWSILRTSASVFSTNTTAVLHILTGMCGMERQTGPPDRTAHSFGSQIGVVRCCVCGGNASEAFVSRNSRATRNARRPGRVKHRYFGWYCEGVPIRPARRNALPGFPRDW